MRGIDKSEMGNASSRSLTLLASLALAVLPIVVHARIGETLAECENRYGAATGTRHDERWGEQTSFKKDAITITVSFGPDGKAWSITYETGLDLRGEFTEEEVERLLRISGFKKWTTERPDRPPKLGDDMFSKIGIFTDDSGLQARWSRVTLPSKGRHTDLINITTEKAREAMALRTIPGL